MKQFLVALVILIVCVANQHLAHAVPLITDGKFAHSECVETNKTINDEAIAWSQVCSCRSYSGVPHTCYYSSIYDYDSSCYAKCVREANQ